VNMNKDYKSVPQIMNISDIISTGSSFFVAYYYFLKRCGVSSDDNKQIFEELEKVCKSNKNNQVNVEATMAKELSSLKRIEQYLFENNIISYLPNSIRRELALMLREQSPTKVLSDPNSITFYDVDQPFGELSNFSEHPVYFDNIIWKTVEHYYQASKFNNTRIKEKIRHAESPVIAKDISQLYSHEIAPNWTVNKIMVMEKSVTGKFNQHPELQKILTSTGDKRIIELSPYDAFWGDPGDGSGENNLGKILMRLRKKFKK